jgi:hypothetical protein
MKRYEVDRMTMDPEIARRTVKRALIALGISIFLGLVVIGGSVYLYVRQESEQAFQSEFRTASSRADCRAGIQLEEVRLVLEGVFTIEELLEASIPPDPAERDRLLAELRALRTRVEVITEDTPDDRFAKECARP